MKGIRVSLGIAIGRAFVLEKHMFSYEKITLDSIEQIDNELLKFTNSIKYANLDLMELIDTSNDVESKEILEIQLEFLKDEQFVEDVKNKILTEKKSANDAIIETENQFIQIFEELEDSYMKERIIDFSDVVNRVLSHLNNHKQTRNINEKSIIIAEDITPSDLISFNLENVIGFAMELGGETSHVSILARSKNIPALVGCSNLLDNVKSGDIVIVDAENAEVIVNPDKQTIEDYKATLKQLEIKTNKLKSLNDVESITQDGQKVTLMANISTIGELDDALLFGFQGIGLLRTEMFFMNRTTLPSEDEQFEFYKQIASKSKNAPVIVRTMDIGGDKNIPYLNLPIEQNPFLGYRAIRICLDREDIFIPQIRAILRASVFGDFKIMLPMITTLEEVRMCNDIISRVKQDLRIDQISFNENIEVGIMIEVPSAAIIADILAKEVDFFSIGTNDLCQYTLAVDRMNGKISHLYNPFNPSVLRLIKFVVEQAKINNIHVGMCGEFAANEKATLLLLGLGLREFSMSSSSINKIKDIIINNIVEDAESLSNKVMSMNSVHEISQFLKII